MQKVDFKKYLGNPFLCVCGREHVCAVEDIIIGERVLEQLPEVLAKYNYKNICVVSDVNTQKAAGVKIHDILDQNNIIYQKLIFPDKFLIPDEQAIGKMTIELDRNCDLIIAIGSGTINDICKYMSYRLKIDYFIIATAPSMDGYASNVAPLIINHTKITMEVGMPKIIMADLEILCQAPMEMIAAGVGDVLGKYICLMDWKLAHIIKDEYYCNYVVELVTGAIEKVTAASDKLVKRDKAAICSVMEALILSGIGMSYIGNSRPASGSEHHLSHYWEMMALLDGKKIQLHGTKVAIGTIICLQLYKFVRESIETETQKMNPTPIFDIEEWKKQIHKVYGNAAESVIELEKKVGKNSTSSVELERSSLEKQEKAICEEIRKLPSTESLIEILCSMDAKILPEQVEVDNQILANSIWYAKDLRNRFGLLQLLYDLDLQEAAVQYIEKWMKME